MTSSTALLRFDPLLLVHKAVRHVLFDVAMHVGTVDASDIFALDRCAKQVGRLTDLLPDSAPALMPLCNALYQRNADSRHAAAAALYREVTALVATELGRQQHAEATSTAELHARHTDDELRTMRREQLGAMSEAELAEAIGPLGAALTPQELAAFLDDLQTSVDAQTFECLADSLRRRIDAPRWARVVRERGVAGDLQVESDRSGAVVHHGEPAAPALHRRPHRADRHRLRAQ